MRDSADVDHSCAGAQDRGSQDGRATAARSIRAVLMAFVATAAWLPIRPPDAALGAADAPGLPALVRTKHRSFTIPFRVPKSQDPDADAAAQRVLLQVSKDQGSTWELAGETSPTATSLTFRADVDGEYWFRLRAVDRKGRTRGGEGPDMRVLVDAAAPRLVGRVWKGADGEIVCRYAAVDDSISIESLKLEYRGPGDAAWKTVAAEGILARESPAHMVGEEIWWAGEKVETLTVRITVSDAAGNPTVRQFSLEPTDPRVDQAALAAELGVTPLPSRETDEEIGSGETASAAAQAALSASPAFTTRTTAAGGSPWTAEPSTWARAESAGEGRDVSADGQRRSVLVKRTTSPAATAGGSPADAATATTTGPRLDALGADPLTTDVRQPGALSLASGGGGQPLEYRGKPLHLSRSRHFTWDYELPAPAADGSQLRAELWSTRDGGVTWQQTAVDADGRSPIDVQLPAAGLYGFRLELAAAGTGGGPRSGDAPETWVGIDEDPPQVDLLEITRTEDEEAEFLIRYAARDPLLAPRSVRLLYSPHADGPWATIASGLESQGDHRWRPDRGVPARVYVRIEVSDFAGNVGFAASEEPVAVARSRFVGKLGGLRPLPAPAGP